MEGTDGRPFANLCYSMQAGRGKVVPGSLGDANGAEGRQASSETRGPSAGRFESFHCRSKQVCKHDKYGLRHHAMGVLRTKYVRVQVQCELKMAARGAVQTA